MRGNEGVSMSVYARCARIMHVWERKRFLPVIAGECLEYCVVWLHLTTSGYGLGFSYVYYGFWFAYNIGCCVLDRRLYITS